jgi:NAD/NADP transhydrogenase beta subunit
MTAQDIHSRASRRFLHRLLAAGGVALVLMLSVLAASPTLHAWLHCSAGQADHECAITLYQQGVAAAGIGIILAAVALVVLARVVTTPADLHLAPSPYWLPPGHAPPAR